MSSVFLTHTKSSVGQGTLQNSCFFCDPNCLIGWLLWVNVCALWRGCKTLHLLASEVTRFCPRFMSLPICEGVVRCGFSRASEGSEIRNGEHQQNLLLTFQYFIWMLWKPLQFLFSLPAGCSAANSRLSIFLNILQIFFLLPFYVRSCLFHLNGDLLFV